MNFPRRNVYPTHPTYPDKHHRITTVTYYTKGKIYPLDLSAIDTKPLLCRGKTLFNGGRSTEEFP